ncbi:hypothetical protein CAP36_04925 [Chitinophagaceae bacterium IBVUCB2]|nr:hypothetical protein CAP36_04925 [Chitinophagaceae bacterium IBVUCB2]
MEKSTPNQLNDNMLTIHGFLNDSYQQAKQHIQEGVSFLKTELFSIHDKSTCYINRMMMPVNNFLKDITEIESELQQELTKDASHCLCIDGQMVPAEVVLITQPMEENY